MRTCVSTSPTAILQVIFHYIYSFSKRIIAIRKQETKYSTFCSKIKHPHLSDYDCKRGKRKPYYCKTQHFIFSSYSFFIVPLSVQLQSSHSLTCSFFLSLFLHYEIPFSNCLSVIGHLCER